MPLKRFLAKRKSIQSGMTTIFSSEEGIIIFFEVLVGLAFCLASLLIFLKFTQEVLEANVNRFDAWTATSLYSIRTPHLTTFMEFMSSLGYGFCLVLAAVLCISLLIKKHKKEAVLFALATGFGVLLNIILKDTIQRPRPEVSQLVTAAMSSFPSGHAMNAFIFYSLIAYYSLHFFKSKKITAILTVLASCIILLIGVSRVYLGVHFTTDVLAGYIAGFWWLITVLLIDRTLIFYKLFKKSE